MASMHAWKEYQPPFAQVCCDPLNCFEVFLGWKFLAFGNSFSNAQLPTVKTV